MADGTSLTGRPIGRQPTLIVGQATSTGQVRPTNEDSLLCEPAEAATVARRGRFCAVADGMGGHAAGDVASDLAVRYARDAYYASSDDAPDRALREAVALANRAIHAAGTGATGREHMGTTLTAAVLIGDEIVVGHVGDSRCYVVSDGTIQQLTRDHSWVAEAVAAGDLTDAEARAHPRRNIITRALGLGPRVEVDTHVAPLTAGTVVVLCSDGLHGLVRDDEISRYVASLPPDRAADGLVALANERGGPDNISVLVVRVEEPGEGTLYPSIAVDAERTTPVRAVTVPRPPIETRDATPAPVTGASPEGLHAVHRRDVPPAADSDDAPSHAATTTSGASSRAASPTGPPSRGANPALIMLMLLGLVVLGAGVGLLLVRALGIGQ